MSTPARAATAAAPQTTPPPATSAEGAALSLAKEIGVRGRSDDATAPMPPALATSFDLLATAPQGVAKLRELILSLAVRGKLVPPVASIQQWQQTTLGALGEWGSGGTPLRTNVDYYVKGTIPWLVIGDLNDGVVVEAATSITESGLASSSAKIIPAGTLLIAMYGSIGKLGIAGITCATNQAIAHCKPDETVILRLYLFYFLLAIRPALLQQGKGLAQQNISQKILKSVAIDIPPLTEQACIVARVEELMQLCDALEAHGRLQDEQHARLIATLFDALVTSESAHALAENWQRIATHFDLLLDRPEAVDSLEQTLLQLAVRGLLVPQDPADEPASELLQRICKEKSHLIAEGKVKRGKPLPPITGEEKPFELPTGWEWVRVGNVGITQTGGTPASNKPEYFDGNFPFIGPGQITPGGEVLPPEKFISELGRSESSIAEPGDILMVCIGGSIGKCAAAPFSMAFNQQINSIHPLLASIEFILTAMTECDFVSTVVSTATGSATPIISKGKWDLLLLPLPPLAEQHRIVARVEQLRGLCTELRERLQQSRATQSSLAEALAAQAGSPNVGQSK